MQIFDFALSGRKFVYLLFSIGRCPILGYKRLSAFFFYKILMRLPWAIFIFRFVLKKKMYLCR